VVFRRRNLSFSATSEVGLHENHKALPKRFALVLTHLLGAVPALAYRDEPFPSQFGNGTVLNLRGRIVVPAARDLWRQECKHLCFIESLRFFCCFSR
jgi:hypothetical protein